MRHRTSNIQKDRSADPAESGATRRSYSASASSYVGAVAGFTFLLLVVVAFIHVHGTYMFPAGFDVIRRIFHAQYALLGGALLALLLYAVPGAGVQRVVRIILLFLLFLGAAWTGLWVLVHRVFGIELTPAVVIDVLVNDAPISEMGVSAAQSTAAILIAIGVIALLIAATETLTRHHGNEIRRRCLVAFGGLFLLVHLPVRAYLIHHIRRNDFAVLAYDDCVPFSLRSERLLTSKSERLALPNPASTERTKRYLEQLPRLTTVAIPHRYNVLWLNVESLRFDGITPAAFPQLLRKQDQFQLKLAAEHWSNANATHFAVFSMLTGLAGYQAPALLRARQSDPLMALLQNSGYAVRIGKRAHLASADLLPLLPAACSCADIDTQFQRGDPAMVDAYLKDRKSTDAPRFDFLAFDATHWPYCFEPRDEVFRPAPELTTSVFARGWMHFSRSNEEMQVVRNRYGDACHSVDRELARVLDDLSARGGFADTIVIVTGDHGEEFQERGQITHSAVLNDFQARTLLWMHLPDRSAAPVSVLGPTMHIDIVPTILQSLGFTGDVLYTQGRSLLGKIEDRPLLSLSEQGGVSVPQYRCLVSPTYISRWRYTPGEYLFSGVQRRDGKLVEGNAWSDEVRAHYAGTAAMYELLPDVSAPPRPFGAPTSTTMSPIVTIH